MSSTQKLTKKQKKGLAFRERKAGKRPARDDLSEIEANAIPVVEDQDLAGGDGDTIEVERDDYKKTGKAVDNAIGDEGKRKESKVGSKGKGEAEKQGVPDPVEVVKKEKKRKRESETAEGDGQSKKTAKRKRLDADEKTPVDTEKAGKQRFILFVGNLKYTTTLQAIQAHFAACDPPPSVRLLTPKVVPGAPAQRPKSKGCAFLEFTHRNALQQGLKLHQSMLDGRMVNVELTAGGGGKSESRLTKVRERNKALLGQREERIEKEGSKDSFPNLPTRPQRYSATSGIDQQPSTKRTWTVGDVQEETHRGGERHRKRGKSTGKTWGTGVNAIPVG
ncbi:hypothetical protein M413DRAFT_439487 [Hebeloma cylindrosporum]|uniref:RRM domain-containing protein n=1 Tax=Hebeloma cylindrosporum TaxID=76867 RepID=A0A0C2YDC7_HEBCY|nr:hypothetical protein M413DRAFT_439487 [Hebeloma cylindrosporum h7]